MRTLFLLISMLGCSFLNSVCQSVSLQILPCEYGARYVLAAEKYDSVTVVAVGGPGRVGYYNIRSEQWTWECLPFISELTSIFVTDTALWVAGEAGIVWTKTVKSSAWQSLEFPSSSTITGIQRHPDGLIVCTNHGEIYTMNEGTKQWRLVHREPDFVCAKLSVRGRVIAVPGQNGKSMFSQDGGDTWYPGPAPMDTMHLSCALVVSDSEILLCGAPGRIVKSIDAGKSWGQVFQLIPETPYRPSDGQERTDTFRKLSMDDKGNIYVCGNLWRKRSDDVNFEIVAKSTNSGDSWTTAELPEYFIPNNFESQYFVNPGIGVVMLNEREGVVLSGSVTTGQTISAHHTTDAGKTWEFKSVHESLGSHELEPDGRFAKYSNDWVGATCLADGGYLVLNSELETNTGKQVGSAVLKIRGEKVNNAMVDTIVQFPTPYSRLSKSGNTLFLCGSTNIYGTSTDDGATWKEHQVDIPDFTVSQIVSLKYDGYGQLICSVSSKDFTSVSKWGFIAPLVSADSGKSWRILELDYQDSVQYRLFGVDVLNNGRAMIRISLLGRNNNDTLKIGELRKDGSVRFLPDVPDSVRINLKHLGYDVHLGNTPIYILSSFERVGGVARIYHNLVAFDDLSLAWSVQRISWSFNGKSVELGNTRILQVHRDVDRLVAIGEFNLICSSLDGGASWFCESTSNPQIPRYSNGFCVSNNEFTFFGTNRSLYRFNPRYTTTGVSGTFVTPKRNAPDSCEQPGFFLQLHMYTGELVKVISGDQPFINFESLNLSGIYGFYCYTLRTPCGLKRGVVNLGNP